MKILTIDEWSRREIQIHSRVLILVLMKDKKSALSEFHDR